jgi:hypothetical protein
MDKYAVLLSEENGDHPTFEATDVSLDAATKIASAHARVDCRPVGRAVRSFVAPSGAGRVWSVVGSKNNK